jgi:hypothetical protein
MAGKCQREHLKVHAVDDERDEHGYGDHRPCAAERLCGDHAAECPRFR